MQRINMVEQYVREQQKLCKLEDKSQGVTADMVAKALNIWRSDASRDLNSLVKLGVLKKTETYPVYFSVSDVQFDSEIIEEAPPEPFSKVIGYKGSLKSQIQTARAAASYPPYGINTFIVGESGVGKTMLAEEIWRYVCKLRGKQTIPFVAYNCAEHTDNPQLLLSHLFGHVKGAFTGADRDKSGIVELANEGVLLLDEIHRLPKTGQEMLFTVMDKGTLRPLGSIKDKKIDLMIIGATTEHIDSAVLDTFKRRMPVIIKIPKLGERPLKERFDLVTLFFTEESRKLSMPIYIGKDVVKHLTAFESKTNIGDLKNEVQICCAKGYLRYIDQHKNEGKEYITILKQDLSRAIIIERNKEPDIDAFLNEMVQGDYILITPLMVQMNVAGNASSGLMGELSPATWHLARKILEKAENDLVASYDENTAESIALWLEQVRSYINQGGIIENAFDSITLQDDREGGFVLSVAPMIEELMGSKLLEGELSLLALLLRQHSRNKYEEKTGTVRFGMILVSYSNELIVGIAGFVNEIFNTKLVYPVQLCESDQLEKRLVKLLPTLTKLSNMKGIVILTDEKDLIQKKKYIQKITRVPCCIMPKLNMSIATEMAKTILVSNESQGIESIVNIIKRRNSVESLMDMIKGRSELGG